MLVIEQFSVYVHEYAFLCPSCSSATLHLSYVQAFQWCKRSNFCKHWLLEFYNVLENVTIESKESVSPCLVLFST